MHTLMACYPIHLPSCTHHPHPTTLPHLTPPHSHQIEQNPQSLEVNRQPRPQTCLLFLPQLHQLTPHSPILNLPSHKIIFTNNSIILTIASTMVDHGVYSPIQNTTLSTCHPGRQNITKHKLWLSTQPPLCYNIHLPIYIVVDNLSPCTYSKTIEILHRLTNTTWSQPPCCHLRTYCNTSEPNPPHQNKVPRMHSRQWHNQQAHNQRPQGWILHTTFKIKMSVERVLFDILVYILYIRNMYCFSLVCTF